MHLASVLPLIALPLSLAKSIAIGVGQGGLVFQPESVTADVGDVLQFHFYPKNHSVVQGSFSTPCQPLAGGVYSGFEPVEAGEGKAVFQVTVNSTDAAYYYCSQIDHCQHGMAMVVNPPPTGNTLAAYKAASANATTISPPAVAGGVYVSAPGNSTSSSPANNSTTSGNPTIVPTPSPAPFTGGATGNLLSQSSLFGLVCLSGFALAMI